MKTILKWVITGLGVLGAIGCLIAIALTWWLSGRALDVVEQVFVAAENGVVSLTQFTAEAEQRVQSLKVSTDELFQELEKWSLREVEEKIAAQQALPEKLEATANKVSVGVEQADQWLQLMESSLDSTQRFCQTLDTAGVAAPLAKIQPVVGELQEVRVRFNRSKESLGQFHLALQNELNGDQADSKQREAGGKLKELAGRLFITLGEVDQRVAAARGRLMRFEESLHRDQDTAVWWMRLVSWLTILLWAWLGIGQVALVYLAVPRNRSAV